MVKQYKAHPTVAACTGAKKYLELNNPKSFNIKLPKRGFEPPRPLRTLEPESPRVLSKSPIGISISYAVQHDYQLQAPLWHRSVYIAGRYLTEAANSANQPA
ncbi:hypothetical protein V144x_02860 [Gimesia aquarii]|uniref:Uncharacterized protein n=1 Tax=Gimesia aquarii TaxID=2527964 RepID=A0A517VPF5_9PLAN|nr:hypothetical protein V144x_02860 [Gimesia aquarii]